jgi:hypothetical protein
MESQTSKRLSGLHEEVWREAQRRTLEQYRESMARQEDRVAGAQRDYEAARAKAEVARLLVQAETACWRMMDAWRLYLEVFDAIVEHRYSEEGCTFLDCPTRRDLERARADAFVRHGRFQAAHDAACKEMNTYCDGMGIESPYPF